MTVKLAGNEHRGSVFIRGDMMEVTSEFGSSKSKVLKGDLKLDPLSAAQALLIELVGPHQST